MEPDLARMAQLSRRYARYGHSLPGLSLALGGLVMLLMLIAPPWIGNNAKACREDQFGLLALTAAALMTVWILAKEWLRDRIYQSLGFAESAQTPSTAVFIRILAAALAALALAYPLRLLWAHTAPSPSSIQVYVGLTACWAIPWCTIRFIRGWQEGLLWAVLCFWTLALTWVFPLWEGMGRGEDPITGIFILALPVAYFGGLTVGLVQHFNFMRLAKEIRAQEPLDD